MFKKNIAIAISVGALSLTGCGLAPTGQQAHSPAAAGGNTSTSQSAAPAAARAAYTTPSSATASKAAAAKAASAKAAAAKTAAARAAAAKAATAKTAAATTTAAQAAAAPVQAAPAVVAPATAAPAPAAAPANAASAVVAPALAATAATAPAGSGTQAASALGWGSVVAGDEFNYTGAPDGTKWSVYNSSGHAGKGLRSPKAWSVANGVATVSGDSAGTTGGMSAKFAKQKYGRWETRMKTNQRDPEYHPVLILWPDTKSSTCAEIDYSESTSDTALVKFFLHYACSGSSKQTYSSKAVDTTQWHNYAVEWTPAGITGYIDGVKTFTDTNPAHQPSGSMHQTLQLDWFPDGSRTTPSQMQVDWVRVYK
ncbi:glycoside hydrolase family 16 protein [Arthrobacter sp. NPDC056691]|uniref:glycoside hydrolase family 16 protein n=1 Tax=Arthrobacter sp. NPDC056691 TaxID=3345913 RepID=UPI0036720E04